MQISVVIPTYNGSKILEKTLPLTINALEKFDENEIVIVNNNSKDNNSDFISSKYRQIRLLNLDKNYGFTKAVNDGVKMANYEYVCILNNDCYLEKDTLLKLYDFLVNHKEYVATQPIIINLKTISIENIGYIVNLKKGKAEIITNDKFKFEDYIVDDIFQQGYVYGLSAACLLIRKRVFLEIGMFDESFHSYQEDVDLFIRLAMKKYRYAPCLNCSVKHDHMATSRKMGSYKESHDFTNWIRLIKKNYPSMFILLHFPTLFIERLRNLSGFLKKVV